MDKRKATDSKNLTKKKKQKTLNTIIGHTIVCSDIWEQNLYFLSQLEKPREPVKFWYALWFSY